MKKSVVAWLVGALAVAGLGSVGLARSRQASSDARGAVPAPTVTNAESQKPANKVSDDMARLRALALADSRGTTRLDQSILTYRQAAEKAPTRVESWVMLGRAWVAKARTSADPGFYVHANACADIALQLSPNDHLALGLRTLVMLNNHQFDDARKVAQALTAVRPDDALAWGSLSDTLLEVGRVEEAKDAAEKMIGIKPSLPSYSRAAYLAWIYGDEERATKFSRLAIDSGRDPHDMEPWAWQMTEAAMLFWHRGDYEGALAGFNTVNEVYGVYAPALAGKGRALLSLGRPKDAMGYLKTAYELAPLVETASLLCDAYAGADQSDDAAKACARAEEEGERTDSRSLAMFYAVRGEKSERALALAQEEMKLRPGIYTQDALAWALYRNHRYAEAKVASDRALAYGTRDARLMYHAGAIRIAMGDAVGGKKLVEKALAQNPAFDAHGAREARALVGKKS